MKNKKIAVAAPVRIPSNLAEIIAAHFNTDVDTVIALENCCGIADYGPLGPSSLEHQINIIAGLLQEKDFNNDTGYGQIIISDVISSKRWIETKELAWKGPITKNPNSGNNIQLYVITKDTLKKLFKLLPKERQIDILKSGRKALKENKDAW